MNIKIFSLIFILSSSCLFGQDNLFMGMNAGLTYSDFRGNIFFDKYEYGPDFLFGLSLDFRTKERLVLSTNLNYERKSAIFYYEESQVVGEGGSITIIGMPLGESPKPKPKLKFQTRFEFVTLPVMIKYLFGKNNEFFIYGGPHLNYLLNIVNIDNGEKSDLDFNNSFKKTSYGISLGFGYIFEIDNNNSLSVELRDNFGFSNMNKENNGMFNDTKSNSINLILNWNFKI